MKQKQLNFDFQELSYPSVLVIQDIILQEKTLKAFGEQDG